MPLRCEIISQERRLYDEEVDMVTAPSAAGIIGILPRHTPLVTSLDFGELIVKKGAAEEYFAIGGGVLEVANDHVIVLAESAEFADEIDLSRAEEARQRAQGLMAEGVPEDPEQFAALEAAIRRANLRLRVGARHSGAGQKVVRLERDEDE